MLGVIILLETMPIGKGLHEKWQNVPLDALDKKLFLHNAGEDQDFQYPSPHLNLIGMLHPRFWLGWHAFVPEAGLIHENHVIKSLPPVPSNHSQNAR